MATNKEIKPGVWVRSGDRTAIVFQPSKESPDLELHFVDETGATFAIAPMTVGVRVATRSEIPEARRPTVEAGAALGYVD